MGQVPAAVFKIPTESPQLAPVRVSRPKRQAKPAARPGRARLVLSVLLRGDRILRAAAVARQGC